MTEMSYENWMPENDKFLKSKEIDIHNAFHNELASSEVTLSSLFETATRKFRIEALTEAIKRAGVKVEGKILEVGAGDGWCSAYLCRNYDVSEVYTMEINLTAVEKLIPKSFKVSGVPESKFTTVLGSFNDIKKKEYFDFVFVMGALHHSSNLYTTFKNIYKSLKPGGFLIAQEPYMHNNAENSFYSKREGEEIDFKGILKVKNNERTDLFYRECEYRVSGFHAGFNYRSERVLKPAEKAQLGIFKKTLPENLDKPNNLIIYAQKPFELISVPVTNWEEGLK